MKNDNRRRYNNNNNRRNSKPQRPKRCVLNIPLYIDQSVDDDLYNDIIDALAECPFDKVSYPIGAARWVVYPDQDMDEAYRKKLMTIGYIQDFDADNVSFNVVIFNNASEVISKIENPVVTLQYITTREGALKTITKINIEPTFANDEDTEKESDEVVVTVEEDTAAVEENEDSMVLKAANVSDNEVVADSVHILGNDVDVIENDCAD